MTATETPGGNVLAASNRGDAREVPDVPARITTWTIRIPSPGFWITSNNQSSNPYGRGRRVKAWRESAYCAALATRPKPPTGLQLVRVDVHYLWAKAPVREMANLAPSLKAAIDGLGPRRGTSVGYGLFVDDSDRHLIYGEHSFELIDVSPARRALDPYAGAIRLTFTDISGSAG